MYNKKVIRAFIISLICLLSPFILLVFALVTRGGFDFDWAGGFAFGFLLVGILLIFIFIALIISLFLAIKGLKEIKLQSGQKGKGLGIAVLIIDGFIILGLLQFLIDLFNPPF